ncbi:hypothetical protein ACWGH4_00430 [Streptomyces sp. NPDC054847]
MTASEFRTAHGDPQTWTTADIEAQQNLAEIDQLPDPHASADRLRTLLAPAA